MGQRGSTLGRILALHMLDPIPGTQQGSRGTAKSNPE